ncbi:hypothetical protein Btru_005087 [Bulinus truncatus]|nr:hypothetical protein Btru_005087 [Bulinus truncatus]
MYAEQILTQGSRHVIEFFSEGLQSDWMAFCSRRLYVFCEDVGDRFHLENVRQKVETERMKGFAPSRINSTVYRDFVGASQELVKDPYYRVNRRLASGQPVVIHVINPPAWLVNDFKKIRCPANACVFDMDGVTEETDVIMAHGVKLTDDMMPSRRWPGQLYVMYGRESPLHYHSDILEDDSVLEPDFDVVARNKTKFAVWLVSNCDTPSLRKEYVEEMKKYIQVDIFGYCGNTSDCPRNDRGQCMDDILGSYKFYLSFENSMCPDYVTEKFFKIFHQNLNIVPVVRGGADYDRFFPKGSFINAGWFKTAKELALHLKNMSHQTYVRYLETRRMFQKGILYPIICYVCDGIILQKSTPKIYDIKTWIEQRCPVPRFL